MSPCLSPGDRGHGTCCPIESDSVNEEQVARVQDVYRRQLVEWAESQGDPKRANRLFREHHEYYKSIRGSEEGRAAISGLLTDPVEAVCLVAATHSLAWDEPKAIAVLDDLQTHPNLFSVDAKYTLKSYRDGRLNLDW
jgi:hypothetical protein